MSSNNCFFILLCFHCHKSPLCYFHVLPNSNFLYVFDITCGNIVDAKCIVCSISKNGTLLNAKRVKNETVSHLCCILPTLEY